MSTDLPKKISSTLKQGVMNNKAYTLKPIDCPIKLNQNESPFDLPENLKKEITDKLMDKNWNIYPDFVPENLYQKVANYYKLNNENILIGNGSNEMIFTILAATIEKGKKIIIPQPTFTVYKLISSNLNADLKLIELNEDYTFNIDAICEEAKSEGSITVLCSPNNPTGTYIPLNDIKRIIQSSNGIVIVDEAYIHFGGETALECIKEYENLIVLRTFSKAFGLAGLRIGMMISNAKMIQQLSKVKLPYNLNIFTLTTLDTLFDHTQIIDKHINFIKSERDRITKFLRSINEITLIESVTNFFLVKVADSQYLFEQLVKRGILIRDVSSYPMLNNCLRISIGNAEENNKLIQSLKEIYSEEK